MSLFRQGRQVPDLIVTMSLFLLFFLLKSSLTGIFHFCKNFLILLFQVAGSNNAEKCSRYSELRRYPVRAGVYCSRNAGEAGFGTKSGPRNRKNDFMLPVLCFDVIPNSICSLIFPVRKSLAFKKAFNIISSIIYVFKLIEF